LSGGEPTLLEPVRHPRALWLALGACAGMVLLASEDTSLPLSVPLGALLAAVAGGALLHFFGYFEPVAPAIVRVPLRQLAFPALALGGALFAFWGAARLSVAGVLPAPRASSGLLVTSTLLGTLFAFGKLLEAARILRSKERPLLQRHGFWLLAGAIAVYVPMLGSFSLLDPWETHYAEVAREILARRDWVSLWWGHEGWFFSKPALTFWLFGLSFSLLGVSVEPDRVLIDTAGRALFPEWAVRLPVLLLTLVASYLVYQLVRRAAGRSAGVLGGLVLSTSPFWSLLSHQAMTDMPYVAPLTAALVCVGLALFTDDSERAPSIDFFAFGRAISVSGFHALFGLVLLTVLPQLTYLVSCNLTLQLSAPPYGFRFHLDEIVSGSSSGTCGFAGAEACRVLAPQLPALQPFLMALLFGAALLYLLELNRGECRLKRLYYLAAWYTTALAALAKGAPGLALPLATTALAIALSRRWRELLSVEVAGFCLLLASVCLPWYVQSYARHGEPFTDRLLLHDMYKRAFVHVHDTNAGLDVSIRYYLGQLGYGLFPWSGAAFAGACLALGGAGPDDDKRRALLLLSASWFIASFGVFSVSLTKFHHYVLPCLPPLAVFTALAFEEAPGRQRPALFAVLALSGALLTLLVTRDLARSLPGDVSASARLFHLFSYKYQRPWPAQLDFEIIQGVIGSVAAAGFAALAFPALRRAALASCCLAGGACAVYALNLYMPALASHYGQRDLVLAYYGSRRSAAEPLIAYQMNWKGENFYTGNRVISFLSSGKKLERFLASRRASDRRTLFVLTEHTRLVNLKRELGPVASFTRLTSKLQHDQFALLRVELAPD
jgi:4-amino-4-deoxy-L-arabinose transferase-like glycosyltransferase